MKSEIMGTLTGDQFFASLLFAIIGLVISLLLQANSRDIRSENTPVHFSYTFLIRDNFRRILLSFLLIIVTIRFFQELTGKELTMFWALGIGLGLDKISELLKNRLAIFQANRDKIN